MVPIKKRPPTHVENLPHFDERRYPEYTAWACNTIVVAWQEIAKPKETGKKLHKRYCNDKLVAPCSRVLMLDNLDKELEERYAFPHRTEENTDCTRLDYQKWAYGSVYSLLWRYGTSFGCSPQTMWEDILQEVLLGFLLGGKWITSGRVLPRDRILPNGKRLSEEAEFRSFIKRRTADWLRRENAPYKGIRRKISLSNADEGLYEGFAMDLSSTAERLEPIKVDDRRITPAQDAEEPWRTGTGQIVWDITPGGKRKRGEWTWKTGGLLRGSLDTTLLLAMPLLGPEAWKHLEFQTLEQFRERQRLKLRKTSGTGFDDSTAEGKRQRNIINEIVYPSKRRSPNKSEKLKRKEGKPTRIPPGEAGLWELYFQDKYRRAKEWHDPKAFGEAMRKDEQQKADMARDQQKAVKIFKKVFMQKANRILVPLPERVRLMYPENKMPSFPHYRHTDYLPLRRTETLALKPIVRDRIDDLYNILEELLPILWRKGWACLVTPPGLPDDDPRHRAQDPDRQAKSTASDLPSSPWR